MKKVLFSIILILNTYFIQAQKDMPVTNYSYKHEFQVETGTFFNQLFRLFGLAKDTAQFPVSPYIFGYKYKLNRTQALRLGIGVDFRNTNTRLGQFADNRTTSSFSSDLRAGYEFQRFLAEKWLWTYGFDVYGSVGQSKIIIDSGFDKNTTTIDNKTLGFGLVTGIRYDFNPRVSVGSEMSLSTLRTQSSTKRTFTANPQFNENVSETVDVRTRFIGPANVYLSIRF